MADLMAAQRDHSFDDRLRRGKTWVYHALVEREGAVVMACGDGLHIEGSVEPAAGLLESEKCRRPGCKQQFAKAKDQP